MRLHRLELHGFKSFADRTSFEFGTGITAIVGPNGCGKSNIVDAIRWVLGELNPRHLRGKQMMDVVFHGTKNRRPASHAEVSLTFINDMGRLPIDMREVTVGRRLHRSGESEYLLNGDRCRLKDIRQLFMDTGVGVDTYSVMEQGKVDSLLQAGPRDRRFLFEEAAGISKFKSQRAETLRRLDRVDQNLARLKDVLAEVDSRVRSVKHQALKAQRYKELEARIFEVGLQLVRAKDQRFATKLAKRLAEQEKLGQKLEAARAARDSGGVEHDKLAEQTRQVRDKLEATRRELIETRGRAATGAERVQLGRQRLDELALDEERFRTDQARLNERVASLETELARCGEDVGTLSAARDAQSQALESARDQEMRLRAEMTALEDQIETHKRVAMAALEARGQAHNELAAIEAEARTLDARRARIAHRRKELAQRISARQKELDRVARNVDQMRGEIDSLREELGTNQELLAETGNRLESLANQIADQRDRRAGITSRLEILEALERKREGIGDGTKWLLDQASTGGCRGVRGTVADQLDVPDRFARAVAAALGRLAEAVVVADSDAAGRLVKQLKQQKLGGVCLVPMDAQSAAPGKVPAGYRSLAAEIGGALAQHLLGDVLIAKDLAGARKAPSGWRAVTPDGDLAVRGRIELAGESQSTGLIMRKSEIKARNKELKEVEKVLGKLVNQRAVLLQKSAGLQEKLSEIADTLHGQELAAQALRSEQEEIGRQLETIREEDEVLSEEVKELEDIAASLTERAQSLEDEVAQQSAAKDTAEQALSQLATGLAGMRAELDQVAQAWSSAQVRLAQTEEKERSARVLLEATQQDLGERRHELEGARLGEAQCQQRRTETTSMIDRETLAEKEALAAAAVLDGRQAELEQALAELAAAHESARGKLREISEKLDQLGDKSAELAVARRELEVARENLQQRAMDELGVDLATLEPDPEPQPDENGELPPPVNIPRLEKEFARLKRRIGRLGPINIDSIEELAEHEERACFLRTQQDDLVAAQEELMQIITTLETSCQEKFAASFYEIRENFRTLFRKLFGGGKADLVLEDQEDLLESGIEIIARPPGKEPRSISLLSGGERAMTAIALLFAVYQTRPSPFCLLDEIDAPLDQANIDRFTRLVREFLAVSQFLIITHSKQTITVADTLFGITASEPGVSKPVSVHLDTAARHIEEPAVAQTA